MSEVEKFWEAIRAKWPKPTLPFNQLHPIEQQRVVHGINLILGVLDENH